MRPGRLDGLPAQGLDRLEEGFRIQREFTADAAHELRTPLSILRTRIDILQDQEMREALRQAKDRGLEVARMHPSEQAACQDLLKECGLR